MKFAQGLIVGLLFGSAAVFISYEKSAFLGLPGVSVTLAESTLTTAMKDVQRECENRMAAAIESAERQCETKLSRVQQDEHEEESAEEGAQEPAEEPAEDFADSTELKDPASMTPYGCPPGLPKIQSILQEEGSEKFSMHHYERYYASWFRDMRCRSTLRLVEIGASQASLKAWDRMFQSSSKTILGVADSDRSSENAMDSLISKGPWDIIIDNGSSAAGQMLFCLFSLWNSLAPGGMYIIQNLHQNFGVNEVAAERPLANQAWAVVQKIEEIQQVLMRHQLGARDLSVMPGDHNLISVEWGMNVVKLRKCTELECASPPRWREVRVDMDRMVAWNDRATATNPKITKRPGTLPQPMSQPRSIEAPAFADVSGSPYPCPKGLKSIASLIKKSGSDKYKNHRYDHYYERWFREIRCKPKIKVIEIGANQGHSLNAWDTIFTSPGKTVLGLAYGGPAMGVEKKVRRGVGVLFGDQSKKKTMEDLIARGPWDIIIDDGSHVPYHMVFSFFSLWKAVVPGGLYVIEDLETNYWLPGRRVYGYKLKNTGIDTDAGHSAVKKVEQLTKALMRFQLGARGLTVMPGDGDICSVEWGHNLVKIRKCTEEEAAANPTWKTPIFDPQEMEAWIQEAQRTNPRV